jgi:hypothetical protein
LVINQNCIKMHGQQNIKLFLVYFVSLYIFGLSGPIIRRYNRMYKTIVTYYSFQMTVCCPGWIGIPTWCTAYVVHRVGLSLHSFKICLRSWKDKLLENMEVFHLQQKYKKENITFIFFILLYVCQNTYLQYCNRLGTAIRRFWRVNVYKLGTLLKKCHVIATP